MVCLIQNCQFKITIMMKNKIITLGPVRDWKDNICCYPQTIESRDPRLLLPHPHPLTEAKLNGILVLNQCLWIFFLSYRTCQPFQLPHGVKMCSMADAWELKADPPSVRLMQRNANNDNDCSTTWEILNWNCWKFYWPSFSVHWPLPCGKRIVVAAGFPKQW